MSVKSYIQSTRQELTHVKWPKRKQVLFVTLAVVIISIFVGYFLGFFDFVFSTGLSKLLNR